MIAEIAKHMISACFAVSAVSSDPCARYGSYGTILRLVGAAGATDESGIAPVW
jgi:hypothetical protein